MLHFNTHFPILQLFYLFLALNSCFSSSYLNKNNTNLLTESLNGKYEGIGVEVRNTEEGKEAPLWLNKEAVLKIINYGKTQE